MAEVAPAGGGTGPNRIFLVLVLGLVGLLILGAIGLGGFFLFQQFTKPVATGPTPTVRIVAITPTRVAAAVATGTALPTDTPTVAPTATNVLPAVTVAPGSTSVIAGTVVITGTPGTGTPGGGQLPQSGIGEDLLLLGGGIVLVLIIFVARRARSATA